MDSLDREQVRTYLLDMERPAYEQANHRVWVDANLTRFLRTLSLVPPGIAGQRCLEIGSMPYTFTLLMKKFRSYELTLLDFFAGAARQHRETVRLPRQNETHDLVSTLCDIEREELPLPDGSFDGVLCCEVLEHLTTDPVAMLAEVHRVLKPQGWLILTTPNVTSIANILNLVHGRNVFGPYELVFGPTWRHNREYTAAEVTDLVSGTGFAIDHCSVEEVADQPHWQGLVKRLLHYRYGKPYEPQLYLRARRGTAFRWYYPPSLFEHAELRIVPRYDFVRVGENDSIQLGPGWDTIRPSAGTPPIRWLAGSPLSAYLRTQHGARQLAIDLFRTPTGSRQLTLTASPYPLAERGSGQTVQYSLQDGWQTLLLPVPSTDATALEIRFAAEWDQQHNDSGIALREIRWAASEETTHIKQ